MKKTIYNVQRIMYDLSENEVKKALLTHLEDEHMVVAGDSNKVLFNNDGTATVMVEYVQTKKD